MPFEDDGIAGMCADGRPARRSAKRPKVKSGEYEECMTEKDKKVSLHEDKKVGEAL